MPALFKYVINKYGVAFKFSEEHVIPRGTEGYTAAQKQDLCKRLADEWKVDVESVAHSIYYIHVENETMTCDRGFTVPLGLSVTEFVAAYEV
jgi:hypothetical protein